MKRLTLFWYLVGKVSLFRFFTFLLIFCLHSSVFSQTFTIIDCPVNGVSVDSSNSDNASACFDVSDVFDNCKTIYLRINIHFFLNGNCGGSVHPAGIPVDPSQAYRMAEEMVNQVNDVWNNNQDQINANLWNIPNTQTPTPFASAHCVPIQLLLSGVYIHCDAVGDQSIEWGDLHTLQNAFAVNQSNELNYYFVELIGGTTGVGFSTYGAIDWLEKGNFTHEIGHTLSLAHSWYDNEVCDDTPPIHFDFDYNCDGSLAFNETDKQCGEGLLAMFSLPDSRIDRYHTLPQGGLGGDGVHDCDAPLTSPCPQAVIPCCQQKYQNNNVMSYGYPKEALTACQIDEMLNDINNNKCSYIAQIGGSCPPVNAFVSVLPTEATQYDCTFCLYFNGSANENKYYYSLYQILNGQEILIHQSPVVNKSAGNVCFRLDGKNQDFHLSPNAQYRVQLTVENKCGASDTQSYSFTTPASSCLPDADINITLDANPNPSSGWAQVDFDLPKDGQTWIYATNLLTGAQKIIAENYEGVTGPQTIDFDAGSWESGTYYILLTHESGVGGAQFIKM